MNTVKQVSGSSHVLAKVPNNISPLTGSLSLPVGKKFDTVQDWLKEVIQKAGMCGYIAGKPTNCMPDINDGYDDGKCQPYLAGPSTPGKLKERFLYRLAMTFGSGGPWNSPTIALMREAGQGKTVTIRLSRMSGAVQTMGDKEMLQVATDVSYRLGSIRQHATSEYMIHREALHNTVLRLYSSRIHNSISALKNLFHENRVQIEDFISTTLGLFDDESEGRDEAIGDRLIALNVLINIPNSPFKLKLGEATYTNEEMSGIIEEAHNLYHLKGGAIQKRLRAILDIAVADSLYNHIHILAQPKRCTDTFIACARACKSFEKVTIEFGMPTVASAISTPPVFQSTNALQHKQAAPLTDVGDIPKHQPVMPQDIQYPDDEGGVLAQARRYLEPADRSIDLSALQPMAKRHAFGLVAALLNGSIPDPEWEAFYVFGFVACRSKAEAQTLGGLYIEILTTSRSKSMVFTHLWHSAEKNQLPQFFDRHGWHGFRSELPELENFLGKPSDRRESVYYLIQFLHQENNTDPPVLLNRDYGFHLCRQRDEVESLKHIYREVLNVRTPLQLHHACTSGELRKVVASAGVEVHARHARLLQNQAKPGRGYNKILGRFEMDQGIFRSQKIQRLRMPTV